MNKSTLNKLIVGLFLASTTVAAMAEGSASSEVRTGTAGATVSTDASVGSTSTMSATDVRAEYKSARTECNKMTGTDRRSCLRDAKATRNSHMRGKAAASDGENDHTAQGGPTRNYGSTGGFGSKGSANGSMSSGGTVGGSGSGAVGTGTPSGARSMNTQPNTSPSNPPSDGSGNTVPSTNSK